MALEIIAGLVVIRFAGFVCSAVAGHHLPAVAAEQLGGQQILLFVPVVGRSLLVAGENVLDPSISSSSMILGIPSGVSCQS